MKRKTIGKVVSQIAMLFCICKCGNKEGLTIKDVSIEHETEFGGAYIHITIEDFLKWG